MKIFRFTALLVALLLPSGLFSVYKSSYDIERERIKYCMVEALWHEARGENEKGIRAVATVILNRTKHKNFPSGVCEVIRQKKQFSYTNVLHYGNTRVKQGDNAITRVKSRDFTPVVDNQESKLYIIETVANEVADKKFIPSFNGKILYYHATYVNPSWASKMKTKVVIGKHIFKESND